jgi:uncharacterized membrane protein YdbT with pleckstrin-like domain
MAYPRELLSPGEDIIAEFRPHWFQIVVPTLITLGAVVAIILMVSWTDGTAQWIGIGGIFLVWAFLTVAGFLRWWFESHVITSERVIYRSGVIRRRGTEIPLEQINAVAFSQGLIERLVKAGDLRIESAGATGQTHYQNIPRPEQVQTLIYQVREKRMFELKGAGTTPAPASSNAEQLSILSRLHDEGKLSDEEFEVQKRRLLEA